MSSKQELCSQHHLMLFDLSVYGHHPSYIQYLLEYWEKHSINGKLSVVVSQQFLSEHSDVVQYAKRETCRNVEFVAIKPNEEANLASRSNGFNRNRRNFQEWQLFCQYGKDLQADHALVMYFDTYQLPIALGFSPPCKTSAIYFRPTFHYPQLSGNPPSFREKLQHLWERVLLNRVLSDKNFKILLSLDPFVSNYVEGATSASVVHLPDPVRLETSLEDLDAQLQRLRIQLGIDASRTVFLMFGALTARKGIYKVLEAIPLIDDTLSQKICLLLVGEADENNRRLIDEKVNHLSSQYSVQIIRHYDFVPDAEVSTYFHLADAVLATYQRHVGMSGILNWSASVRKPVLSSDYGLMGALVQEYELGSVLDTTDPEQIAKYIEKYVINPPDCVSSKSAAFALQNSHESFARVIFRVSHKVI